MHVNFLGQMEKPKYETIRGLSPTISSEQKTTSRNPRSTVGTITEISDYLRVLFARIGQQHCYKCDAPVEQQSANRIVKTLLKKDAGSRLTILVPLLVNRKRQRELIEEARASGFTRLRINGEITKIADIENLDKKKKKNTMSCCR